MADNAFFYWFAAPAEWGKERFERFEKELTEGVLKGQVERVERFTTDGKDNVFTLFSTPEYIGHQYSERYEDGGQNPPRSEFYVFTDLDLQFVSDATESTKLDELGLLPSQRAERLRQLLYPVTVTTKEEEAHASFQEAPLPKSNPLAAVLFAVGAAGLILYAMRHKAR